MIQLKKIDFGLCFFGFKAKLISSRTSFSKDQNVVLLIFCRSSQQKFYQIKPLCKLYFKTGKMLRWVKSFAIFWHMLVCKTYVLVEADSIVLVGTLTCCALLHSVWNLKAAQINVQHCLLQEFMLYKSELSHNTTEATKNIYHTKGVVAVYHSTVFKWFKKFHFGYKNFGNQARSGRPKAMDSEAVLQARETNLTSTTWRVSGKLAISLFSVIHHLHNVDKILQNIQIVFHVTKIFQNFWLTLR